MTLKELQYKQKMWSNRNFPNQKPYQCLLGLAEEVGELSHAHLKREQGIRGSEEQHIEDQKDAIGDIIIFLAGYGNSNDFDLQGCVDNAWSVVEKRDWTKNGR